MKDLLGRMAWGLLAGALALAGCQFSRPTGEHPSLQGAPASADSSTEARVAALFATARKDFGCERVDVVLTFDRRYANSASVRYVVDGCGKRALYAETCEAYPTCRYLLLSIMEVPFRAPVGAPSTPPAGEASF
jgi:hypothetical protein